MSDEMVGGWTAFSFAITEEAMKVFKKAINGLVGVNYTPFAFATQVVEGINYCFLCKGKVVYPDAPERVFKVNIFSPLKGDPHITQILEIKP